MQCEIFTLHVLVVILVVEDHSYTWRQRQNFQVIPEINSGQALNLFQELKKRSRNLCAMTCICHPERSEGSLAQNDRNRFTYSPFITSIHPVRQTKIPAIYFHSALPAGKNLLPILIASGLNLHFANVNSSLIFLMFLYIFSVLQMHKKLFCGGKFLPVQSPKYLHKIIHNLSLITIS